MCMSKGAKPERARSVPLSRDTKVGGFAVGSRFCGVTAALCNSFAVLGEELFSSYGAVSSRSFSCWLCVDVVVLCRTLTDSKNAYIKASEGLEQQSQTGEVIVKHFFLPLFKAFLYMSLGWCPPDHEGNRCWFSLLQPRKCNFRSKTKSP